MFSNIKENFYLYYVVVVTRRRDAICVGFYIFSSDEFPPQPDYEQQLMDESRFRQQLEARNKSKKNERKHGIKFPVSSPGRYSVNMFFR